MRLSTLSHGEMLNRRAQARRAADRLDLTEEEPGASSTNSWPWPVGKPIPAASAMPRAPGEKGKNQAIAEWPTACGPADYAVIVD